MLPPKTEQLIHDYVEETKQILRNDLVGVYLHGSAVMGCFHPQRSDLDFIIVVSRPMSDAVKRTYLDMVVKYNALGPAKGIEMSVVLRDVCMPFVYPTPFELHFSAGHLDWYREDPDDYIREMKGTDQDLAAHFTIIGKRGRCLYGPPIAEVFAPVPRRDYMDSIWFDVENAAEEIGAYPLYLTLNLARVLAYKEEGLVLSKKEGGEWALERLPAEYHPLIREALLDYAGTAELVYDQTLTKRYAAYMIGRIQE